MNLFKKKNKSNKNTDDIEIVNLDSDEKIENTLEQRKEFRISILIGVIAVVFVFLLPTITSLFNKDSIFSYSDNVNEIINSETIDGMLEINKEKGYITANKIKFYNPRKTTNNQVSVTYLPMNKISNLNSLNLYIEIYNSNKELIARTKFNDKSQLERKVQGLYKMNLNETLYKEAKYFKVVIIDDKEFSNINDNLICKYNFSDSNVNITYERIYNFTNNGLISYKEIKEVKKINNDEVQETDNTTLQKYLDIFNNENEELKKTNIQDLTLSESALEYTIVLNEFEKNKSNYQKLYEQGSIKRQIELSDESLNWVCE